MAKPPRNHMGGESPIKKWWWCCGESENKDDKRFEDLIQTNGEEEGCDDDETKWKRIISNMEKNERNLNGLHCPTQCRPVFSRPIEEVVISLSFQVMNEFWFIGSVSWNSIEWEWLSENVPLTVIT